MLRLCLLLCALFAAAPRVEAARANPVQISPLGRAGAYLGFAVTVGDTDVARVLFSSNRAITARAVQKTAGALRFTGLSCTPTPALGPQSFVTVCLLPNDPFPEVRFQFDLGRFDRAAWEQRWKQVPFHFLTCSLPGAEVFHQRGWMIGTPVVDDYIQMKAVGPGRSVVSNWSRDWTYAPPIGAYPTAVAGLWNSARRRYVGYDFHGARLTEHSEKEFGTTYCYRNGEEREFFCLTWPYGKGYINLPASPKPARIGTRFRLLWSTEMGPDDDPNAFVHQFLWKSYARLLPDVEQMNDLSWLPNSYRFSDFTPPGPLGDFVHNTGPDGDRWWQPNVNLIHGAGYFSPIDYHYQTGQRASIEKLAREARRAVRLGKWMEVGGERGFFWQTPLDGGGAAMFGPGVQTWRHVNGWSAGIALLDYYRNDPVGAADLLPHIEGVLRATKQILYTRNCYPDVPAAQFAWSATPAATFCWRYYYHFRNDPAHGSLAELARKLARSMTYRYLAIWPCDSDETDDLDSSFFMEPNSGLPWLGCACANEIWVYNIAMLYEYVATGDPIMGHYLRGMLQRYHQMFQDQWFPSVQEYGGAFTERFGLFEGCAQGKGVRGDFGGLWGGFERLIWPQGTARARVVCGEGAAMAFNRDGRHTDIADYRYHGEGDCSFRLVPGGPAAGQGAFDLAVTFPFFDLRGKEITVVRGHEVGRLGEDRVLRYPAEPSTLLLRAVAYGDTVRIGKCMGNPPVLRCAIAKPRTPEMSGGTLSRAGFRMLDLSPAASARIRRDWNDVRSFAGYEPGLKTLYGVPFRLPEADGPATVVTDKSIYLEGAPQHLFFLVDGVSGKSEVVISRGGRPAERVPVQGAIPAVRGWPPVLSWHLDLLAVENAGRPITAITPRGCRVFALTTTDKKPPDLSATLAALDEKRQAILAEENAVREVAALAPLFARCSGHVGILPAPDVKNPRSHPVVKMLMRAGLLQHVVLLSKEDLVNPAAFNARRIRVALYLGFESYYQTVHAGGDGDAALTRWLKSGGTLVSLAGGPFPFYYNEADKAVVSAARFGLPVCGSGANQRTDTLQSATTGWEKPPAGARLTFHVAPGRGVFDRLPAAIPWRSDGDQRWRPILNVVPKGNTYTPLVTLKDEKGRSCGDAAAMIEYRAGDLAGARVLYVWNSLRLHPRCEPALLVGLFRYLLTHALPPVAEVTCIRAAAPPVVDGRLDDAVWRQAPATEAFVRFDAGKAKGRPLKTAARLAWDDENLYVAWECEDPDVWSTLTRRDADLWEGEVVELYLDPDGDGKNYKEMEINPLNAVVDLNIAAAVNGAPQGVPAGRLWNAEGWKTAVRVDGTTENRKDTDRGWTAEMALPLRNFPDAKRLPPRVGDVWRAQLLRIDGGRQAGNAQFLAWSDTNPFHNPERFGRLLFAANPTSDDFGAYESGTAPTSPGAITGGDWKVADGALVGRNSGSDGWAPAGAVLAGPAWTDYRLRLRFQVRQRGSDHRDGAWIGVRYGSPAACYTLALGTAAHLHKTYKGLSTGDTLSLAKASWANDNAWHDLAVTLRGNRIAAELDGKPLLDAVDQNALGVGTVPAGGVCLSARKWSAGKGDTVVAFDDVRLDALSGE